MRQNPGTKQSHGEKVVKDIRRALKVGPHIHEGLYSLRAA